MSDAYEPTLDSFVMSEEELEAITAAMTDEHPWDVKNELVKSVKNKIRAHHLERHGDTCCYCRTNLHGGGHFMIDREHVLPKGKYKRFAYEIWNLSVSCKRCNMQFKIEDDEFVVDKQDGAEFQDSSNYRIVHPNYDEWEQHLDRVSQQSNRKLLVIYAIVNQSEKGRYTYDYFGLKELEVNSFDEGQGIERTAQGNRSDAALEALAIARAHGQ
ncbi:HNH endonuclease [Microvirga arabica]|uniref:HNH endonuclease n=1 Tax=Microvirga arabica TaxID=1128671 RepID=UPI00193A1B20|nr:hypothetical protein [Microvirga arabica]MBM1169923.1 hypothetical protein [Microvirga arabica]